MRSKLKGAFFMIAGAFVLYCGGSAMNGPDGFVPDAHGQAGYDIATEPCTVVDSNGDKFAEHSYPGKTQVELTRLRVLFSLKPPSQVLGRYSDYTGAQQIFIRDGSAAVFCSSSGSSGPTSATFVLPP